MVNRARLCNLMALHLLCRPHAGKDEPILRSEIASIRKLLAEGALAEIYIFLGWLINTRAFLIALPNEKWANWSKSINQLLRQDKASYASSQFQNFLATRSDHTKLPNKSEMIYKLTISPDTSGLKSRNGIHQQDATPSKLQFFGSPQHPE